LKPVSDRRLLAEQYCRLSSRLGELAVLSSKCCCCWLLAAAAAGCCCWAWPGAFTSVQHPWYPIEAIHSWCVASQSYEPAPGGPSQRLESSSKRGSAAGTVAAAVATTRARAGSASSSGSAYRSPPSTSC
jgi:hypothetical protein